MSRACAVPLLVVAAGASLAAAPAAQALSSPTCPRVAGARASPDLEAVAGRSLDRGPLPPEAVDRVLAALDAASPRIRVGTAGTTRAGRPLRYALVGDPAALRGDASRAATAARAVRAGGGAAAVDRALREPAVVWLGGGVHANEPSGTTALLEVLTKLASDDSCATRRILHGTIAVVEPDQNPGGRALGTRTNADGFDLNRDWAAATQPETRARIALLRRYPPTITADLHEQRGGTYFLPPYTPPVLEGLPSRIRRVADHVVGPFASRALRAIGATVVHARGYDLLYPGYADSATSLLFGSGGMTLEQGSGLPFDERVGRHRVAARALLRGVAAHHDTVVRAWAAGFRADVAAGERGASDGGGPTYAWVVRTDRDGPDARAMLARLAAGGVRVRYLSRPARVRRLDPVGPQRAQSQTLPAGTAVLPAAQPARRWLEALLSQDADEAGDASIGEDTWSLPRLSGVDVAVARRPLGAGVRLRRTQPAVPRASTVFGGTGAFAGDSVASARLATALLRSGAAVQRTATGNFRAPLDGRLVAAAAAEGLRVEPVHPLRSDEEARSEREPRVTLLTDASPPLDGPPASLETGERPAGWVGDGLRRLGVRTRTVDADSLAGGVPGGTTHLVLGPGQLPTGGLTATARAQVERFVAGGGTLVLLGSEGIAAGVQAGLSGVRTARAPSRDAVSIVGIPDASTALGAAVGRPSPVVVAGDPRLEAPSGASVPLRAATGAALDPSGPVTTADGLAGRPLVVDERRGRGHVVTFGFSPVFRGQSASGLRVLASALLPGP